MVVRNKKTIRVEMREKRRLLSFDERSRASKALTRNLLQLVGARRVRRIAGYMANDGEIDPFLALLEKYVFSF